MQPDYFPFIATLLAVIGSLASGGGRSGAHPSLDVRLLGIYRALGAFAVAVSFNGAIFLMRQPGGVPSSILSIGVIFVAAFPLFNRKTGLVSAIASAAFLVGLLGALSSFAKGTLPVLELILGVSLGAIIALGASASVPSVIALVASSALISNYLGRSLGANGAFLGSTLLVGAAAAVLVATLLHRFGSESLKKLRTLFIFAIMLAASWIVAKRWLDSNESWMVLGLSTVAAMVVHWLLPEDEESGNLRMGIATVVWCALATFAFGIQKAAGIGEALAAAGLTLVALGNLRAMQSIVPLLAIAFYRVFRELYPGAARSIDIGQHYAIIGVTIGAVAAILPLEWIQQHKWPDGRKALAGLTLWALLLPAIPCLVAMMLGEKGVTGLLVGLGLSALLAGFRSERSVGVLATVAALGGATLVTFGQMDKLLELARDEKVRYFAWSAAVLILLGTLLWWLGSSAKSKELV